MIKSEVDITKTSQKDRETGRFARDVIWISIAQLFGSFIMGIITLPALTKSYSTEIFGIWSQAFVTVALLSPVFCMELDMAVVRFLAGETDKTRTRQALGSMLFSIIALSAVAFIAVNIFAPQISGLLFAGQQYTIFVRLTFLWIIFHALFVFLSAYLRARNRISLLAIRTVILNVIIMALVIGLASQRVPLEWVITSVVIAHAGIALIFFIMIVREIGWPTPSLHGLKSYLAFSIPQIPGVILLWLVASSDRYLITHFLGLSQTGIYSSSNQLASMTRLFYSPLTYVLYPTLSRLWDEKRYTEVKHYLEYSIRVLLTLGIPAAAGIAMLSQPLLQILTTSEFLAGSNLVFLISIGTVFLGIHQINGHIILLEKRTRILPVIIAAGSAISIITNIILLPRIGITGAGISNAVSYLVLAIIVTLWSMKTIHYKFDFMYLFKIVGATIPMVAVLHFLEADGAPGIVLSVVLGTAVYIGGLAALRALSAKDLGLIRGIITGIFRSSR
ncbi:MAG: flippase [Dehalococcoidales bacterium]|nr:flippase [Dehalococcoidales bacterium]